MSGRNKTEGGKDIKIRYDMTTKASDDNKAIISMLCIQQRQIFPCLDLDNGKKFCDCLEPRRMQTKHMNQNASCTLVLWILTVVSSFRQWSTFPDNFQPIVTLIVCLFIFVYKTH